MSSKLVVGIGINDADYAVQPLNGRTQIKCPYYKVWQSMLIRGYCPKYKAKYPAYAAVTVCPEWLTFSNFKAWMEIQDWQGKHLDKDLLVQGNKSYGPYTCIFLPPDVNLFITKGDSARGEWPIGVGYDKRRGKFRSRVRSLGRGSEFLGDYDTPEEAHQAWLIRKRELSIELASRQKDKRISDALLMVKYEEF